MGICTCNTTVTSSIYSVPNARHVPSSLALTTISPPFPSAAPLIGSWCPLCSRTRAPARTSHVRRLWSTEDETTRCGFVGCTNRLVTASCGPPLAHQQQQGMRCREKSKRTAERDLLCARASCATDSCRDPRYTLCRLSRRLRPCLCWSTRQVPRSCHQGRRRC